MPITNIINIYICGYNLLVLLIIIELPASWMNAGSCKHPITFRLRFDSHCRSFASNLEEVANLLCVQANSAFYPPWDGKWVLAYELHGEGLCGWLWRWLRAPERVPFKLATIVLRSLNYTTPLYLAADLRRLSDMPSRRRLRSSLTHQLDVPQSQFSTVGDQVFGVAGARL